MRLGVIGGLGPAATAYFMDLVIRLTQANCDQDHLEMLVYSIPSIPDRTEYILGKSNNNPVPQMIELGNALKKQNVDYIAIPCMTAHYFYNELQKNIDIPILNGIRLTAESMQRADVKRVGIMATDGTMQTGLFQNELKKVGIEIVPLSSEGQKRVMSLIYDDIKTNRPPDMEKFKLVETELREHGAQRIVLGCTELSLIKRDYPLWEGFVDAMEILAANSILACGKELHPKYTNILTK